MERQPERRATQIAKSYLDTNMFKPELLSCGRQMIYEMELDLTAMKWALHRMSNFLKIKNESGRATIPGDNDIEIAFQELLERVSLYSCPNMRKDKSECPLKGNCLCTRRNETT